MHEKNQDPAFHVIFRENKQDTKTISSNYQNISLAERDQILKLISSFLIFKGDTKYLPKISLGAKIPRHCTVRINDKKKKNTKYYNSFLFLHIPSFKIHNM